MSEAPPKKTNPSSGLTPGHTTQTETSPYAGQGPAEEPVSSGIPKKGDDGSRENSFAGQESQMSRDDDDNVSNNEGNASIGDGGSSYGGETAAKQDDGTSTSTAW